jgi:hypothetical protein
VTLKQKLNRIERLLRTLMRLEGPFADALRDFSHSNAQLDQVRLVHAPVKVKELAERRAIRQVESATSVLFEEIETPVPSEWDRAVTELTALGVERNFHSIGTARHLYGNLRSYMTYLGLKDKCDREGRTFPECWREPFEQFSSEFKKIRSD